jgi:hypothetical protein
MVLTERRKHGEKVYKTRPTSEDFSPAEPKGVGLGMKKNGCTKLLAQHRADDATAGRVLELKKNCGPGFGCNIGPEGAASGW